MVASLKIRHSPAVVVVNDGVANGKKLRVEVYGPGAMVKLSPRNAP